MRPDELPIPETPPVDPALIERMTEAARRDLRPVRPLPSTGSLVTTLLVIWFAVAMLGAAQLGFFGLLRLSPGAIAAIFPALGGLALLTSAAAVNAMIPGSRRPFHPLVLLAAGCLVLESILVLLFPDHSLGRFVPQGLACLEAGLLWSIPAGVLAWYALHRGFAVDPGAAGVAAGSFAGLTGLLVLELHCPNFRLPHVAVWHLAVAPVGALAGWAIYFFGSKRKAAELMQ
jgi:hypothetical protein